MGDAITTFPPSATEAGPKGQTGPVGPAGPPGSGGLIGITVLSSSGIFTTGPNTHKIRVRLQGGGGGGGSAKSSLPNTFAAAGGGSAGGYAEKTFTVTPSTGYNFVIGAGGPGGDKSVGGGNNAGTPGGDTTFTVGLTTVTAPGGPAGSSITATGSAAITATPAPSATPTNGDINVPGEPGDPGFIMGPFTTSNCGGGGGTSPFGSGPPFQNPGSTANGFGNGSGGAGAADSFAGGTNGGNGTPGLIIVEEYA